jgi:tetratricopeptide (TPR) repeat protein
MRWKSALSLLAVLQLGGISVAAGERPSLGDLRQVGSITFPTSCARPVRADFVRAVALLHSFFYVEARRIFADVAARDPACAMAAWGVAMTWYHPIWAPPTDEEMKLGLAAITRAQSAGAPTPRERGYIDALATFYRQAPPPTDGAAASPSCHGPGAHPARAQAYAQAMAGVHARYPSDPEAAAFHALALLGSASPVDPSLSNQLAAAKILEELWARNRKHPGVAHYLIHAYDYPSLASRGLEAARTYGAIAPWVPHALHMPSHIFTRLGMWNEANRTNLASAEAARAYAARYHPDATSFEELHALDYLVYGYLQTGQDARARQLVDRVVAVRKTFPEVDFVAAHAVGAIPARYALERHAWREAATLPVPVQAFWERFPFTQAHLEYAHAIGRAHTGDLPGAHAALDRLKQLRAATTDPRYRYFQQHLEVQQQAAAAWIARAEGRNDEALDLLRRAADTEDALGKHPVSPGAIFPVREMLGDLLLDLERPAEALAAYEATLKIYPGRRNALQGQVRARTLLDRRRG